VSPSSAPSGKGQNFVAALVHAALADRYSGGLRVWPALAGMLVRKRSPLRMLKSTYWSTLPPEKSQCHPCVGSGQCAVQFRVIELTGHDNEAIG